MDTASSPVALQGGATKAEITRQNQLSSPLLRLPTELRNRIYTFVGLSTTIRVDAAILFPRSFHTNLPFPLPHLLATCTQIRREANTLVCKLLTVDITGRHADNWLFAKSNNNHGICKLITRLRISEIATTFIEQQVVTYTRSDQKVPIARKLRLPSLERVYVQGAKLRQGRKRWALRTWSGNESLEVEFEEEAEEITFARFYEGFYGD